MNGLAHIEPGRFRLCSGFFLGRFGYGVRWSWSKIAAVR
jgi:hypothetical protein